MSSYRALEDSILNIITSIEAERDPVERLKMARAIQSTVRKALMPVNQSAAYAARMIYPTAQIADLTGIDRKNIEYLVRVYLANNPNAERPKFRKRVEVTSFVDLT